MMGPRAGFTLVELLVVLLIIGVIFAAAPIAYDRMRPGLQLRSDAREIARILRQTRGLAVRDNEEATVLVDLNERFLQIESDGERYGFSEDTILSLVAATSEQVSPDTARIRFFPNGSSTGGRVTLERLGKVYRVEVDWLFGRVRILE